MIYFVRGKRSGMVKIGSTSNVKRRFGELQTGSPEPLEVMAVTEGGAAEERFLHERFAHNRANGEWFHPRRDLLDLIERISRDPRIHPAQHRITRRRRRTNSQERLQGMEAIRLAADHLGIPERAWFERFALPIVADIARKQLSDAGLSDALPTLQATVANGDEDLTPGLSSPGTSAAACSEEEA